MKKTVMSVLPLMIMLLGLVFFGCVKQKKNNLNESDFNGTWGRPGTLMELNDGVFVILTEEGDPICKGTYSIKDDKITLNRTHLHGSLNDLFESDSDWYTKAEMKELVINPNLNDLDKLFPIETARYSLSDNTLTLTYTNDNGFIMEAYIRK